MLAEKASIGRLNFLTDRFHTAVSAITDTLVSALDTVSDWKDAMQGLLARFHIAGYLAGRDDTSIPPNVEAAIKDSIATQLPYLDGFASDIGSGNLSADEIAARAGLYANSITPTFWSGATEDLPLEAMPGEGTECQNNCHCEWSINTIDSPSGDFDCTWKLESGVKHCATCLYRAEHWSLVKIRGWRVAE